MERLLKPVISLLFAVILISGGTFAYSGYAKADAIVMPDTGKPGLKITRDGSRVCAFEVPNAVPGASGRSSNRLVNVGKHAGELGVSFSPITNTPGAIGEHSDGSGDLGANTEIAVYIDINASGDWDSGDVGLRSDGATYRYPTALDYDAMDNYGGIRWNAIESMIASAACDFTIMWYIPITVGNEIQGDSVSFDITFFVEDAVH